MSIYNTSSVQVVRLNLLDISECWFAKYLHDSELSELLLEDYGRHQRLANNLHTTLTNLGNNCDTIPELLSHDLDVDLRKCVLVLGHSIQRSAVVLVRLVDLSRYVQSGPQDGRPSG